jgi:hypothetical protein
MDLMIVQIIRGERLLTAFSEKFSFIIFFIGENFPVKGELRFKVVWGEKEAILEPVGCSENVVIIDQEVAFVTSECDARISNLENVSLLCTYVSSDGTKCDFNPIDLSFYVKSKPSEKVRKINKNSCFNDI